VKSEKKQIEQRITYMERKALCDRLAGCPRGLRKYMAAISSTLSYSTAGREGLCYRSKRSFVDVLKMYEVLERDVSVTTVRWGHGKVYSVECVLEARRG
jgi:hypothetical protein